MTAQDLLAEVRARGITLTVEGGTLTYRAKRGAMTSDLRASLAQRRLEVIALLAGPRPVPGEPAGSRPLVLDAVTLRQVLGTVPTPEAIAAICREVIAALAAVEVGMATGALPPRQF